MGTLRHAIREYVQSHPGVASVELRRAAQRWGVTPDAVSKAAYAMIHAEELRGEPAPDLGLRAKRYFIAATSQVSPPLSAPFASRVIGASEAQHPSPAEGDPIAEIVDRFAAQLAAVVATEVSAVLTSELRTLVEALPMQLKPALAYALGQLSLGDVLAIRSKS